MEVVNEEKDSRWKRADEFFGIHPVAFVDDIINAVNDYMCDATDALECSLRRDFPQKDLQVNVDSFFNNLQSSMDLNLDKFELYILRNILSVPEDVDVEPLPELPSATEKEIAEELKLDSGIKLLRDDINSIRLREAEFRSRVVRLERMLHQFSQVEEHITKYTKSRPTDEQLVQIIKTTEDIKTASRQCEENETSVTTQVLHYV